MGLTSCPDCSQKVSKSAPACPNCGRPLRAGAKKGTTAGSVFGGLFLFFIVLPVVMMLALTSMCVGLVDSPSPARQGPQGKATSAETTRPKTAPSERPREFAVVDDAAASAPVVAAPGSDRALGRIPAGTRVEILEKRAVKHGMLTVTYYRIPFNGKRGWISQYVTTGPQPSPLR